MLSILVYSRGLDLYDINIINGLAKRGLDIHLAYEEKFKSQLHHFTEPMTHHIVNSRRRFDLDAIRRIREVMSTNRFDLVHVHGSKRLACALIAARRLESPPKIVATRGYIGHAHRWNPMSYFTFLNPRVDAIICISKPVEDYLIAQGVPPHKVSTINKGWSADWTNWGQTPPLTEVGVPADAVKVCFVGNAAGRRSKGLDVLLSAWGQLSDCSDAHLLIVGRTDARDTARAAGLARVHFLGYRDDAPGIMKQCDIFVLPSRIEALGRALLEAMLSGLAPVVTDSGGPSVVVRHEVDGLIVPVEDAGAMAGAIRRLVCNPDERKRMAASAKEHIETDYSVATKVDQVLDLYNKVLGTSRKLA